MLQASEVSVNSALQRARATLAAQQPAAGRDAAPAPRSVRERELVGGFADAFEAADTERLAALLTEDAWLTMPPEPLERSEEHTSELQSLRHLVCRLLL